MLIDEVTISIQAGNGGNGAATFRRNAQTAKGGPDGGNGGNGGDVYVTGVDDILGLKDYQFKKKVAAENGVHGGKQNLYGRNGKDIVFTVPLGTVITDTQTNEVWEITNATDKILLATGGKGGRGNNEFKSATNQTPKYAEEGEAGQERIIKLELKLIADIGFIGLPNAGKSSLLKALTNANPKIGNYAFTTLEPNLGVMKIANKDPLILADIPGLIEGASQGKGLGMKFLRHVEKTKMLVHCIDSTSENVLQTYQIVRSELEQYSKEMLKKQEIILLTKSDLVLKEELTNKIKELKKTKKEIFIISIYEDASVTALQDLLSQLTKQQ